ncbi:hypothetical protein [Chlorogloeopsis sp. ULAP02]
MSSKRLQELWVYQLAEKLATNYVHTLTQLAIHPMTNDQWLMTNN